MLDAVAVISMGVILVVGEAQSNNSWLNVRDLCGDFSNKIFYNIFCKFNKRNLRFHSQLRSLN